MALQKHHRITLKFSVKFMQFCVNLSITYLEMSSILLKNLPRCSRLRHLCLVENNVTSLDASSRFPNLESLDLSRNPIQFERNYRSRYVPSLKTRSCKRSNSHPHSLKHSHTHTQFYLGGFLQLSYALWLLLFIIFMSYEIFILSFYFRFYFKNSPNI